MSNVNKSVIPPSPLATLKKVREHPELCSKAELEDAFKFYFVLSNGLKLVRQLAGKDGDGVSAEVLVESSLQKVKSVIVSKISVD